MNAKSLFSTLVLGSAVALAPLGCVGQLGGPTDELGGEYESFEDWEATVFQEEDSGIYIVDGDTPIDDIKKLHEFYERYVQSGDLIVHQSGGVDVKWNDTQKLNITYCVSTTFGTRYSQVVQAMADATGAWEAAANVNFVYLSANDSSCTSSNNNVVFDVNPVNVGGQYIARAFFPNDARASRNVLIDNSAFTGSGNPTLTGVLRHELGHTLGFRHEHTRPESGACFEDNNWRSLTTYDSASVMHYPQCNGTGDWSLTLTAKDIAGAQSLYGAPGGGGGGGGGGGATPVTQNYSGSVTASQMAQVASFNVTAGTTFQVNMTGTGDPDLYVRFGAQPTTAAYTCRPYLTGATESCSLTVPAGTTQAFVAVRGYTAGTYNLAVTYTPSAPGGGGGGTATSETLTGSVVANEQDSFGPFSVLAGTTFNAVMSGTGDPDLYVRFGAQPTTTQYNCRPYLNGASEVCNITVPTGTTQAYVMVRGFASGTYSVALSYTKP